MSQKPIPRSLPRLLAPLTSLALAAALLGLQAPSGLAAAATPPAAGTDYVQLQEPLQVPSREVVEVFYYNCPHSYQLETPLDEWAARQKPQVTVVRIPAAWSDRQDMLAYARLYYTLDRLGIAEREALSVFHAVRDEHWDLTTADAAADWATQQGIDPTAFRAAYDAPEVWNETVAAPALRERYQVEEMPSVVVGGRYRTSPFLAEGGVDGVVPVVDYLLRRTDDPGTAADARPAARPEARPAGR
jgi:thiol:disulfide interchange protein DsbA